MDKIFRQPLLHLFSLLAIIKPQITPVLYPFCYHDSGHFTQRVKIVLFHQWQVSNVSLAIEARKKKKGF